MTSPEEIYDGVKFTTIFAGSEIPHHSKLVELKKWCRIFHAINLAPPYSGGSYGNLSFRIERGNINFIITGTQIGMKDDLSDDKFVEITDCDLSKKSVTVKGTREPSSETMLHFSVYRKFPNVNAVFHGHSPELIAESMKLDIPTTKEKQEYGTVALVKSVIKIIEHNNIIIMKDHGFIAVGKNMKETGNLVLECLEKTENK